MERLSECPRSQKPCAKENGAEPKDWSHTAFVIILVFQKQTALRQHSKRKAYYGFNFHLRISQINHQSRV